MGNKIMESVPTSNGIELKTELSSTDFEQMKMFIPEIISGFKGKIFVLCDDGREVEYHNVTDDGSGNLVTLNAFRTSERVGRILPSQRGDLEVGDNDGFGGNPNRHAIKAILSKRIPQCDPKDRQVA